MVPKIWELFPELARQVKVLHEDVGLVASGHDADHDFEVGQLALMVTWPENQRDAVFAGVAGLLHSCDRIIERAEGLSAQTISTVSSGQVEEMVGRLIRLYTNVSLDLRTEERIIAAVVHHGSKPNKEGDDLIMVAVADADRLANMGANLPIRSG